MMSVPRRDRVGRSEQSRVLAAIVDRIRRLRAGARPVVVFDLDGTLLDNRPRTLAIFQELADRWGPRHPEFAVALRGLGVDDLPYLVDGLFLRLGAPRAELVSEGRQRWAEAFFSNRFLVHDRPYPGAREFAQLCHRAGATVVYFTARDVDNMGSGTVQSLKALGFPFALPRVELVMKPRADASDICFKSAFAAELCEIGQVVAAFDNEPHHCNALASAHPQADIVLIDTQHVPSAPTLDERVRVLGGFEMEERGS